MGYKVMKRIFENKKMLYGIVAIAIIVVFAVTMIIVLAGHHVRNNSETEPSDTVEIVTENAPETEPTTAQETIPETKPVTEPSTEPPTEPPTEPVAEVIYSKVNETVYTTGNVNFRSGAGTDTAKIFKLSRGTKLKRIAIGSNGWSKVEYNGKTGYIFSRYLSKNKPADCTENEINLKTPTVNENGEYIYTYPDGTQSTTPVEGATYVDKNGIERVYNNYRSTVVKIALAQVGNVGGRPYWSWYGYKTRQPWCACFVSWVANKAGCSEDIIPKFSSCAVGVRWFKSKGQWKRRGYTPQTGDVIFFDWELDGTVNHVGFVEKVENGMIYTVEGNSTDDTCRRKEYAINNEYIYGFGIPDY